MFFSLSTQQDKNFVHHYELPNGLILSTDDGWSHATVTDHMVLYKGYVNHCTLEDCMEDLLLQTNPGYKGNFCAFIASNSSVRLVHDTSRAFPLWLSDNCLTNLHEGTEQIWSDCLLTINKDFTVNRQYFHPYTKVIGTLTEEQVIQTLHDTLCTTVEQFLSHNTKPLKVFLSGGIDTTTAWAYVDYFTKDYELIDYQYIKYTPFYKLNSGRLKQFWGYNQIHLWEDDCVLVTGGNGDENMLRGPNTLAMVLDYYNLTFEEILNPEDYHYTYYLKKKIEVQLADDVFDQVLSMNVNDYQHWHLDKTLTFTPFKDISLLETIVAADKDLIVKQTKDAYINKELINKLDPTKLNKLSNQKNFNTLENL
jgi:hypothetical protein